MRILYACLQALLNNHTFKYALILKYSMEYKKVHLNFTSAHTNRRTWNEIYEMHSNTKYTPKLQNCS